ncbi:MULTISPECIES: stage VI sporulation protein D [Shouchella]|uniref:Stage VI sporulation protein D n=1 Tax=Shouchella lehensis G1 TaxID=1246626 RepID=A0A060M516_9BACI|nr:MULTISPECIES: stage VI sporulation protein D [Bacillaceae]AIC95184.1 stage VI sporulation protein D [Shouchella lehensis G1]
MSQEQSSALTFSIEDSVWLNKGQQIDEIIGMSLTPEISVKQMDDHVTIQGGLRFIGEYKMVEERQEEVEEEEDASFTALSDFRHSGDIQTETEAGAGQIEHVFPIDITIPMTRIQHVDDIYVEVSSFDYDLPEKSCIQLTADVSISGVKSDEQQREIELVDSEYKYDVVEDENNPEEPEHTEETAFQFEAYQSDEAVEESHSYEEQGTEERSEQELAYHQRSMEQDIVETFTQSNWQEEETDAEDIATVSDLNDDASPAYRYLTETSEMNELEDQIDEVEEVTEQVGKSERDSASYLTSMLRNEDEQFSRWKMCIIQEEETLQVIADRYELSTSQLTRYNNLDSEKVEEGQIIYIPSKGK